MAVATKCDPKLWEKVKKEITAGGKGGRQGQWSARKAQLAVHEYKARGGKFRGKKSADNSLQQWQEEDWGTKAGRKSTVTGERYLPKKAREALSDDEYQRTTMKKRRDTRRGKQFSPQPGDVRKKAAISRRSGQTKADLYAEATRRGIRGRSRMRKAELVKALS